MAACADCIKPAAFWEGQPTGEEVDMDGIPSYIVKPSSASSKAVLLISDMFGWKQTNTRLLADKFSAAGFTAVLPELFGDDPAPMDSLEAILAWQKRLAPDLIVPRLDAVLTALERDHGVQSVGTIGFCWGGRFAVILGNSHKVAAAVVNHGAFIDDDILRGLKQPLQINASDNDRNVPKERLAEMEAILAAKPELPTDIKFYEGQAHGWTLKGDAADPAVAPAIVDAFQRAKAWFEKYV